MCSFMTFGRLTFLYSKREEKLIKTLLNYFLELWKPLMKDGSVLRLLTLVSL